MGLDDKEYTFDAGMVADLGCGRCGKHRWHHGWSAARAATEETTNVFLEAAFWETIQIAKTGRALKVNSDARYRNERGIDPAYNAQAIEAATQMILDLCGGEASDVVTAGAEPDVSRAYKLDTDRVQSACWHGQSLKRTSRRKTLTALGFEVKDGMAHVPSWRPDVRGSADLVEEVARVASLTKLVGKPLPRTHVGVPKAILSPMQKREGIARRTVAALGYNECVTYSFIDQASAARFGTGGDNVALANPISSEMSHMRPSLLPGLLQAAARNQARGFMDLALVRSWSSIQRRRAGRIRTDGHWYLGWQHRPA